MTRYAVEGIDGLTTIEPGTSLLVTGPSTLIGERVYDAVTPAEGERTVVVTTDGDAGTVAGELRDRGADSEQLGVIDCTGAGVEPQGVPVGQLSSPGDLTGISLEFAKLVDGGDESSPLRVGFDSVSTVLMYAELRTVFRFLHVFTARIRSAEMLGVFAMDPAMHESKTHNTISAVFDCEARVTEEGTELRGSGFERSE